VRSVLTRPVNCVVAAFVARIKQLHAAESGQLPDLGRAWVQGTRSAQESR
jgi:hypothetical protein